MKVIYLAGPYRAATAWRIEENVRAAERLALQLWRRGVAVLCPHTNTRFFHNEAPDALWLDGTMAMLRKCDAVFAMPGCEHSSGSTAELIEARRLGIPVFETLDEVVGWACGQGEEHSKWVTRTTSW